MARHKPDQTRSPPPARNAGGADLLLMIKPIASTKSAELSNSSSRGRQRRARALDHRLMKMTFLCENGRKQRSMREEVPRNNGAVLFIAKQLLVAKQHRCQLSRSAPARQGVTIWRFPSTSKQRIV